MPRVGAALRRGLAVAHDAASACGSTPPARTGRSRTTTSRACGGCSTRCGTADSIYEGYKVVPYCGRCGTALSSHELGQPGAYRDVTEPSVYVRFPSSSRDVDLLVWTTTPWTLPSNVGAAVGPDIDVRARARARRRTRPRARARRGSPPCSATTPTIVGDGRGRASSSARTTSRRSRSCRSTGDGAFRVVADDFVTVDDGSGIVHLAPAFGEIDREVGEREGLPMVNPVNDAGPLRRRGRRAVRGQVREGRRPRARRRAHGARASSSRSSTTRTRIPHCWRCDTPLIYWAKPTWFARTSALQGRAAPRERDDQLAPRAHQARPLRRLAREQRRLGALARPLLGHADPGVALRRLRPRHLRRLGRRAVGALRAATSPAWTCTAPTSTTSRSAARRARTAPRRASSRCSTRGSTRGRCPPRSSTTRSRTTDAFERRFPADFICEAIDQTRGWFYSLLAVNTLVFDADAVPQRRVPRAHRRPGRREDVEVARQRHRPGAGARRDAAPTRCAGTCSRRARRGRPSASTSTASTRRPASSCSRCGTRTRSSSPTPTSTAGHRGARRAAPTHVLDRWIRSRLHRTVARSPTRSRLRRARPAPRPSPSSSTTSRTGTCAARGRASGSRPTRPRTRRCTSACATIAQLLAPFCPFITDELYRNLARHRPIRCTSPTGRRRRRRDRRRARSRDGARAHARVARAAAARNDAKLGVRQPLPARSRCSPRGEHAARRGRARDRRRAQREALRGGRRRSKACSRTASCRTSSARPAARQADPACEGAARRASTAPRCGARSTSSGAFDARRRRRRR